MSPNVIKYTFWVADIATSCAHKQHSSEHVETCAIHNRNLIDVLFSNKHQFKSVHHTVPTPFPSFSILLPSGFIQVLPFTFFPLMHPCLFDSRIDPPSPESTDVSHLLSRVRSIQKWFLRLITPSTPFSLAVPRSFRSRSRTSASIASIGEVRGGGGLGAC